MAYRQLKITASFFLVTVFVFTIIVRNCQSFEEAEDDAQNIHFNWSIFHTDKNGQRKSLDINEKEPVSSGDFLKIFVQPVKNVYVYLYLLDSGNDLALIFPYKMDDLDDNYVLGKGYTIPEGDIWFALDESKGTETFYLLASVKRLHTLEAVTKEYVNASENTREKVRAEVLAEIKDTLKRFSPLATLFAEKPIPTAGSFRSLEEKRDFAENVIQIKAKNFYSKTIRIEHK